MSVPPLQNSQPTSSTEENRPTVSTEENRPATSVEGNRPATSTEENPPKSPAEAPPTDHPIPSLHEYLSEFTELLIRLTQQAGLRCVRSPFLQITKCPYFAKREGFNIVVNPDFLILDETNAILAVVRVADFYLYPNVLGQCLTNEEPIDGAAGKELKELVHLMVSTTVRIGLSTDGFNLIVTELNDNLSHYEENYLHELPNGQKQIKLPPGETLVAPIRTCKLNRYEPAFSEAVLGFLGMAKKFKNEPYSKIFDYFHLGFPSASHQE